MKKTARREKDIVGGKGRQQAEEEGQDGTRKEEEEGSEKAGGWMTVRVKKH